MIRISYFEVEMIFNGKVGASVCDAEARLSVLGAVQLVQDYVSEFYGKNSIDQTTLRAKHNAMWVFTKNRVKFFRSVLWNEEFVVECFVSSLTSVKMVIDTVFYVGEEMVFCSQIENCMVDLSTQKIRRIENIFPKNFVIKPSNFDGSFSRFCNLDYVPYESIQIRSTSIDYCHHTNNTEYVRFVLNSFHVADLVSKQISYFEIHYLSQTHELDRLLLSKSKEDNKTFVLLTKGKEKIAECVLTLT